MTQSPIKHAPFWCTLLLSWLGGICTCQTTHAATYQAGYGQALPGIRQAIARAAEGDTVDVHPGRYREGNILIDKRIVLRGLGNPVLDGEQKWEVISVKADGAVVEGFRIVNSGRSGIEDLAGVRLYSTRNAVIRNNVLDSNSFGIYVQQGSSCTIEGNHIKAYGTTEQLSGNGIHCWKSDDMRIIGNDVSGHRDGIYFEFVTASIIWRNYSHGNIRYGLHFMFSHGDAYVNNIFSRNGAGVAVMETKCISKYGNVLESIWGEAAYGLLLK
jgi:nitrous oxidase accessory protein